MRLAIKQPPEDIDLTLLSTLNALLEKHPEHKFSFDEKTKHRCVAAWHLIPPWPEFAHAIEQVRAAGDEVFVYANGTSRLQLDLCKSSGLKFDMLFSSELLGIYKPAPESYGKVLRLVKVKPKEVVMVAAHAYDVRRGRDAGMRTVYSHRWTGDINKDMEVVRGEVDFCLEDMTSLAAAIGQL